MTNPFPPLLRGGKRPLLAAHRGVCGGNIPCNTEKAFLAALNQGADIIELDVARALDGTLWVFHPGMEYPHVGSRRPLAALKSKTIAGLRFVNADRARTEDRILTLDDAFELLKGKCLLNIDKFWTHPQQIADCIRRHGLSEQVLTKIPDSKSAADKVAAAAPELPLFVIVRGSDEITPYIRERGINLAGVEAIFDREDLPVISKGSIESYHKQGLAVWGNAIVYNYKDVISAGHTDDKAVCGDPDFGWGWFREKGFDIVQTDFLLAAKQYYDRTP